MEEFMESQHSGIFRVELVTKYVVLGSSQIHFMHISVKIWASAEQKQLRVASLA